MGDGEFGYSYTPLSHHRNEYGGLIMFEEFQYKVSRLDFFKMTIVDDARTLLNVSGSYTNAVPDDVAMDAIIQLQTAFDDDEGDMASRIMMTRDKYIFTEPFEGPRYLGLYAKDMDISTSTVPGLKDITRPWIGPEVNMLDGLKEITYKDGTITEWSGIRASRAWMYGGLGVAGWHAEDSLMKFYNIMPQLEFEGLSETEADIIDYVHRISRKRWTFIPSTNTSLFEFSSLISTRFASLSPFGIDALKARTVLLNPNHLPPNCVTLYQKPGQIVHGSNAHSVLGSSLLNVAWNYQDYDDFLTRVLSGEFALGNFRRGQMFERASSLSQLHHNIRNLRPIAAHDFILTCELIDYFLYDAKHPDQEIPGIVRCGRAALQYAHQTAHTQKLIPIARGKLIEVFTAFATQRQCDICTAPCPIEIYEFSNQTAVPPTPFTPIYTCNPCAFKYMTWKHNTSMCTPLLITFVSDLQLKQIM
jgi:hypothetical protein